MQRLCGGNNHSTEITNFTEQVKVQCSNGSYSSDNPLKITILGASWGFRYFDSQIFSHKLAIQLAEIPDVKVTFLVPQNSYISSYFKRQAAIASVTIVEAQEIPGFDDPDDWLYFPPGDLKTDIVVGADERLGKTAQVFKELHQCKSILITSDPLKKHAILLEKRRILEQQIAQCEECNDNDNVGLSQMADVAVALGPKMHDELSASLSYHRKDVFKFTPGILSEFSDVTHATNERTNFRILMLGGGDPDNFEQEGLHTAAEAVAELKDKSYHLFYVGAAKGKHEQFAKKFCQLGVSKSQLTIRSFPKSEEVLKRLFCEVDLAIMPSSEQGFGMVTLAALSSGLPVLVHEDSGFGVALKEVTFGASSTVESEDVNVWAQAIKGLRKKDRKIRLQEAALLRSNYDKQYSWEEQCGALVQKMLTVVSGMNFIQLTCSIFCLSIVIRVQNLINYLNYVISYFLLNSKQVIKGLCKIYKYKLSVCLSYNYIFIFCKL